MAQFTSFNATSTVNSTLESLQAVTSNAQVVASVDTTNDLLTFAIAHGVPNGTPIVVTSSSTQPAGTSATTVYYSGNATSTTFQLFTTLAASQAGTGFVNITSTGSGTITVATCLTNDMGLLPTISTSNSSTTYDITLVVNGQRMVDAGVVTERWTQRITAQNAGGTAAIVGSATNTHANISGSVFASTAASSPFISGNQLVIPVTGVAGYRAQWSATAIETQAIAAPFSGTDPVPDYWFDARQLTGLTNGQAIPQLTDFSGNAAHFTQGGGTNRAFFDANGFNGGPCANFDGVNDYYIGNTAALDLLKNTQGVSIYAVYAVDQVTTKTSDGAHGLFWAAKTAGGTRAQLSHGTKQRVSFSSTRLDAGTATNLGAYQTASEGSNNGGFTGDAGQPVITASIQNYVDGTNWISQTLDNTFKQTGTSGAQAFASSTISATAVNVITTSAAHNLTSGDAVTVSATAGNAIVELTNGTVYYATVLTATTLSVSTTQAGGIAGTGLVTLSALGAGTSPTISAAQTTQTASQASGMYIGALSGPSTYLNGKIAELRIYKTAHNQATRERIIDLLNAKWFPVQITSPQPYQCIQRDVKTNTGTIPIRLETKSTPPITRVDARLTRNCPGTIVVTQGAATVTGTGTTFLTTFKVGDDIVTQSGQVGAVATIPSNTSLTISGVWAQNETSTTRYYLGGPWATLHNGPALTLPTTLNLVNVRSSQGWLQVKVNGSSVVSTQEPLIGVGDVVVVLGQSNDGGRGAVNPHGASASAGAFQNNGIIPTMLGNDDCYRAIQDPFDVNINAVDAVGGDGNQGSSIWCDVANARVTETGIPLLLIPGTRNDSALYGPIVSLTTFWDMSNAPDYTPPTYPAGGSVSANGTWLGSGIRRARLQPNGVRAVIWGHGENPIGRGQTGSAAAITRIASAFNAQGTPARFITKLIQFRRPNIITVLSASTTTLSLALYDSAQSGVIQGLTGSATDVNPGYVWAYPGATLPAGITNGQLCYFRTISTAATPTVSCHLTNGDATGNTNLVNWAAFSGYVQIQWQMSIASIAANVITTTANLPYQNAVRTQCTLYNAAGTYPTVNGVSDAATLASTVYFASINSTARAVTLFAAASGGSALTVTGGSGTTEVRLWTGNSTYGIEAYNTLVSNYNEQIKQLPIARPDLFYPAFIDYSALATEAEYSTTQSNQGNIHFKSPNALTAQVTAAVAALNSALGTN